MTDCNLLRSLFVKKGLTQGKVAEYLGLSTVTMSSRMKSGDFGIEECDKLIDLLDIEDPVPVFFKKKLT